MPSVRVVIAQGPNDVTIKVSDEGGGIPFAQVSSPIHRIGGVGGSSREGIERQSARDLHIHILPSHYAYILGSHMSVLVNNDRSEHPITIAIHVRAQVREIWSYVNSTAVHPTETGGSALPAKVRHGCGVGVRLRECACWVSARAG